MSFRDPRRITEVKLARYAMGPLSLILRRNDCVMSGDFLYSPDDPIGAIDIFAPQTKSESTVAGLVSAFEVPADRINVRPSTCSATDPHCVEVGVQLDRKTRFVNVHAYDIFQTSVVEIVERTYPLVQQHRYYDGAQDHVLGPEVRTSWESGSIVLANTADLMYMNSNRIMRSIRHFSLDLDFVLGPGCWDTLCAHLTHCIRRKSRLVVENWSSMTISGWWKDNMRSWSDLARRLYERDQRHHMPFVYLTLEYPGTDCLRDLRFFFSTRPPDNGESVGRVSRCLVPERPAPSVGRFTWSQTTHNLASDGTLQIGRVLSYGDDSYIHYTAAAPYPTPRRDEVKSLLPETVYDCVEMRNVPRGRYLSEDEENVVICVPDPTGRLHASGITAEAIDFCTRYLPCLRDQHWEAPNDIAGSMYAMELMALRLPTGPHFVPSTQVDQALRQGSRIWVLRDSGYRWDRAQNVDEDDIESGNSTAFCQEGSGFQIHFVYLVPFT